MRWIVTLDVLKYKFSDEWIWNKIKLNSNIRCIEILTEILISFGKSLNSNIRCIEMIHLSVLIPLQTVLNSNIRCIEIYKKYSFAAGTYSWIVTLDVLKYRTSITGGCCILLNSNIRCIEILFSQTLTSFLSRWIVTLDVLKF